MNRPPGKRRDAAVLAREIPARRPSSRAPEPYYSRLCSRENRPLGEAFGIANFGVNLTTLPPGAESSLFHRHTKQDEFIFVLEGEVTLRSGQTTVLLREGMCAGFPAGGDAHQLINLSGSFVIYLEAGDRSAGDRIDFPEDGMTLSCDEDGQLIFETWGRG